jgi:16S rRNA (adenine1518-N6/adenine1519-N6)-dimethyltransferase
VSHLSDDIRRLLQQYNIRPKKKRGQSFLSSQTIAREIVGLANLSEKDDILEIGGGLGVLTQYIAEKAHTVYVVEIDPDLVKALRDLMRDFANVTIIEGDALTVDMPKVSKIIANLPYSISSEITFRILRDMKFELAILMYQKEFASRLIADPGTSEYSRLTINARYYAEVEKIFDVPASMFFPVPAVDSSVVRMVQRIKGPFAKDNSVFHWMIGGVYPYPNKSLRNALRIWFRNLGVDRTLLEEILIRSEGVLSGDEHLRSIGLGELVCLADILLELMNEGKIVDSRV